MTASSVWIYVVVALGAVGVYFMLPRSGRSTKSAGILVALATLCGLILLSLNRIESVTRLSIYFYVFAAIAVVCAVCVITQRQAVYSALYFVALVLAVAGMVVLLEAEFLAMALIIIYAGAILVTYVFVIMLAQQSGDALYDRRARAPFAACFVGFMLVAAIGGAMVDFPDQSSRSAVQPAGFAADSDETQGVAVGNVRAVGAIVLTKYVLVFEVAGVLLLLAMVGAIAIARMKFPRDESQQKQLEENLGRAGREAAPF